MFRAFHALLTTCLLCLSMSFPVLAGGESLTVLAAVSLKDVLEEAGKMFTARGGQEVKFSFVSSGLAAKQIEAGLAVDIYASAGVDWMDDLSAKKLIQPDTRSNLLGNSLVLIVPETSTIMKILISSDAIANAIGDGKFAISDPTNTASGEYGKTAFKKLGLWDTIEPRLLIAKNDRAATLSVERGDAKLGLVYYTETKINQTVRAVATLPEESHSPIIYSFAATSTSKGDGAKRFLEYLKTPTATAIFEKAGFTLLSK